jgi:hypothetical protein
VLKKPGTPGFFVHSGRRRRALYLGSSS